jgi:hypothetical protein
MGVSKKAMYTPQMSNVFSFGCRDLDKSAVSTFAAKAFLQCFAGVRSPAKPQA